MHWMLCLSRLLILLSKHIHTFLPITFLLFNGFWICKKFWKAETHGFLNHTIFYYTCRHRRHKTRISNAFNAIYVDTVDTKHIHTFLPITFLIFNRFLNPQKVLESWNSGLFNHTIFTIHVDTVNTRQGSLMHSMLPMSTLSIQFSHLTFTLYKVLCKRHKHQCRHCRQTWHSVHRMLWSSYRQCRQNKIPYSIHNSIALIFCIDHLDIPYTVMYIRTCYVYVDTVDTKIKAMLHIVYWVGYLVCQHCRHCRYKDQSIQCI